MLLRCLESATKRRRADRQSRLGDRDFEIAAGDPLPLTLFPDDPDLSRNLKFHVAGVFRSFPPTEPVTEMVINAAGLPPYLGGDGRARRRRLRARRVALAAAVRRTAAASVLREP